jgi:hypothetical protein
MPSPILQRQLTASPRPADQLAFYHKVSACREQRISTLPKGSIELLGQLDNGRTFRFTAPSDAEPAYEQESRTLTVVDLDLSAADGREARLVGSLTYTD